MVYYRLTVLVVILQMSTRTLAEPPVSSRGSNGNVNPKLLNRVADIIAKGGDGSVRAGDDGTQNNEGPSIVDQELIDRIARIISQNQGQVSWSNKARLNNDHAAQPSLDLTLPRNGNEHEYGVPPIEVPEAAGDLAGPQFQLSVPQSVPRIAAFEFTDDDNRYSESSPVHVFQDSYAYNGNRYQERPEFEQPQKADRIASFDIQGETPPAPFTAPQLRRGYFTNSK